MENNQFNDNSISRVHVQGNQENSTDHHASQNDHLKEVYQYPQSDWSKEVSQRAFPAPDSYPEAFSGFVGPNPPQLVDRESHPEALAGQHPSTGPVDESRARYPRLKQYKWLILVAMIIVIGAVTGGALGGILGKRDKNGQGTVNTSSASWPVLNISNLAATNWTDNDGNAFHAVFWQSTSNHLIVSTFNGSSGNWTATNISSMVSTTALQGTLMAAVVRGLQFSSFGPFGIVLFYITPNNTLADLYSPDLAATIWQIGNFTQSGALVQAASGSQLAARWGLCGLRDCTGNVWLAYEDEEHSLRLAGSNGWAVSPGTLATSITPSSAMAMTATNRIQPISLDYWDGASSARLYFEESQTLQQWGLNDGSGSWYNSSFNLPASKISHADKYFTTQPVLRLLSCPRFHQK